MLISDLPEHYAVKEGSTGRLDVWAVARSGHATTLRGMFSGANHPLEADMQWIMDRTGLPPEAVVLRSGTIKGMVAGNLIPLSPEAVQHRPRGTLLSFLFPLSPINEHRWRIKTFLLE
jgi:hypothetical protein